MMEEIISVIVPVYNTEQYIERCLSSIVQQTYTNLEIIVIDNGSTDLSGVICDEFAKKDSRVQVIHKEHGDVPANGLGVKIASGKYIGFVCSDDWIEKDMYEVLLEALKRNETDISICGYYSTVLDQDVIDFDTGNSNQEILYSKESALEALIEDKIIKNFMWDKLYRREAFHNILFSEDNTYDDVNVMYKIFLNVTKIVRIDIPKYYYYQRAGSILNAGGKRLWWDLFRSYEEQTQIIPDDFLTCRKKIVKRVIEYGISYYNSLLIDQNSDENDKKNREHIRLWIKQNKHQYFKNMYGTILQNFRLLLFLNNWYDSIYKTLKHK